MKHLFQRFADFFRESDKILLSLCFFTTLYGCFSVFSATHYMASFRPVIVQTVCMFLGIVAALIISTFDLEKFFEKWYLIAIVGVVPVLLTFFVGIAPEGTDDKAWLDLGITAFQPSELLKICFIVTFSLHLSRIKSNINKPKYLLPLCAHGAAPVVLIHFQGDDGTALVFAIIVLFMMWSAGVSWKYFVAAFSAALVASPFIYFFVMNDDHRARIKLLFDIDADIKGVGYQQWLGRRALAGGGFLGQGYLQGNLTQAGIIPESHNDFIFVGIGEELGFLGCIAVIILLAAICLRCIKITKLCTKESNKYICIGVFAMIFSQSLVNIGMCISVLPVIGVTLPFFSAGGTSLLCLYLGVGLVLNVYKHKNERTLYLSA
ncbi:MAG: FtsW/RodA/SpoVE family cell cycle protein [Clostridia bacterium]|nr:FtsW/RodA/SpoVE family cell cycle protein [Clostridia bacterium]